MLFRSNLLLSLDQEGTEQESLSGLTILLRVTELERLLLQMQVIKEFNCSVQTESFKRR